MKIAGFMKVRNEIVRGNLYRALANLEDVCDGGIICDDGSTDGTGQHLDAWVKTRPHWMLYRTGGLGAGFAQEMVVKQFMMRMLHEARENAPDVHAYDWIWWLDGDEEIERPKEFRKWIQEKADADAYKFHYTQLWRNEHWARTDDGFDDGVFCKLWRYRPDLSFDTTSGTHKQQFPQQVVFAKAPVAPFEVTHWGNVGKCLQFKAHQYAGGLGGVDRHLAFGHSPHDSLATGEGYDQAHWSRPNPTYRAVDLSAEPEPKPFTFEEIKRIRRMGNLRSLDGFFTVVVPAYNRARDLPRALDSLLYQTYQDWVAVVLDDGSTDDTATIMKGYEAEPRIFYCPYRENRGGVAMNEIGMAMACEMTEFWSRLGSDDWWGPGKLAADARALREADAVFGPFTVWKHGRADHVCAGQWTEGNPSDLLKAGRFAASWVNVAVRTSILRKVRERWGNFCDPSLRNMEDFLVNYRIACLTEWAWHPGETGDAFWNCLEGIGAPSSASASANAEVTARDDARTRELIARGG